MSAYVCALPCNQTDNDKDLKFGTNTCLGHIKKPGNLFLERMSLRHDASFKELTQYGDFLVYF